MPELPFTPMLVEAEEGQGPSRGHEPAILPARWRRHSLPGSTGFTHSDGLKVICSIARERDGKEWLHVSASRESRLPSWEDMRAVKDIFAGCEAKAVIVLPPRSEYVNQHPYVLHLWVCLDADPLPDFRKRGTL